MIPITPPRWPQIGPSLIRAPWRGVYVPGGSFSPLSLGDALAAWWRGDSGLLTGGGRKNVRANISEFRGTLTTAPTSGWVSAFVYVDAHIYPSFIFSLGDANNRVAVWSNGTDLWFYQAVSGVSTINSVELTGTNVTGRWYHLFVRWDGTGYEAFVNGVSVQSASGDYSVPSMTTTIGVFGNDTPSIASSNYTASARIAKLAIGTTYEPGMEATLCNLQNGLLYGSLTNSQKTNWGLLNYYNCNESLGTDDLIDQHGGDDLAPTFAELLSNTGFETAGAGGPDVFANWSETTDGTGALLDETSIVDAGSHSCKLTSGDPASANYAGVSQSVLTIGHRFTHSVRARHDGTSATLVIYTGFNSSSRTEHILTGAFATYSATATASGNTSLLLTNFDALANSTLYLDTVSCKAVDILPCDGPAEDIASDSIGTNHGQVSVGSESSAAKWSSDRPAALAGVVDGSFVFDMTDDKIVSRNTTGFPTTTGSISGWFRTSQSGGFFVIAGTMTNNGWSDGFGLVKMPNDKLRFYVNGYTTNYAESDAVINDGEWHHAVGSWDGTNIKLYIDGVLQATTDTFTGTVTHHSVLTIGADPVSDYWSGKLCDVRVYSDGLSLSQAVELAAGSEATGDTPVAQWKLGDGPQTPVTDGDPILEFRSKDTYRWQAIQSTQANRPEYEATGIGGRGSLVFDGSNDCLSVADDTDTGTSGCLTWVARPSALSGDHVVVSSADVAAANKYFHSGFDSAGKVYVETNVSGTTTRVTGNTVCSTGNDYVVTISSTGSAWSITVNGVAQTLTVTGSNTGNWFGDVSGRDNVVLGALVTSGGTSKLLNGLLGEVVLCTDNTKADQIHAYARAYWGT